jgi:hypothetical protein
MDHDTAVERVLARAPEVLGEVMPGLERHRRWSVEEKLRILAQSVALLMNFGFSRNFRAVLGSRSGAE